MKRQNKNPRKNPRDKKNNYKPDFFNEDMENQRSRRVKQEPLRALNQKQDKYIKAIKNNPVTIALGSAGTSKTYIPSIIASDMFLRKEIQKIIICRPMEGPGRHIMALPGTKNEKLMDWLTPVVNTIKKRLGPGNFNFHLKRGNIELCALCQIKGRSFDDSFIIADEAEDMDIETIKSLVTRIGEDTKLVINGDIKQKNIKQKSGLGYIIDLVRKYNLTVPVVEFTLNECIRSETTRMFLECFEKEEEEENQNKN